MYFTLGPYFNKALETGFSRTREGGFSFEISFKTRGDHAGFLFWVEFFGWQFEFSIHDIRHWDYEEQCWELPFYRRQGTRDEYDVSCITPGDGVDRPK